MEPPRIQTSYMFDTEHKRAVRHSNMLLECIERERQAKIKKQQDSCKGDIVLSVQVTN